MEKACFPITMMCKELDVSRAGFYAWCGRPESPRAQEDRRLAILVREAHERGRKTYGSPRVHAELQANEVFVSRKRVIRLMQAAGIRGRVRRRYKCTTMSDHDHPVAPNLLDRKFDPVAPNQSWVGDVTELVTNDGKLYLAVVLDLFSRFAIGWALSAVNDRHLAIRALEMALRRRCPDAGLLHHSDQGSPYASEDYEDVLSAHGHHLQHESARQLLRQCGDGELLQQPQAGTRRAVRDARLGQGPAVRSHRGVLQPAAASLGSRLRESGRAREGSTVEVGGVVKLSTEPDQAQGGMRVRGFLRPADQPASRAPIEPRYLVHGKVSSMVGAGLATATIDGLTFPFNFLPALRGLAADRESRTVV